MGSEIVLGSIATAWAMALTVLMARWDKLSLSEIGVVPDNRSSVRLGIGLGMGLIIVAVWWVALAASGYVEWIRFADTTPMTVAIALLAFVVLSSREELAFHGYPLQRLRKPFGIWGAQLFVTMIFVVEHMAGGWNWTQALFGAGVGSLLFGMAAIATRGLAIPIGVHAGWNFGHWSLGHKGTAGIWSATAVEGYDDEAQFVGMIAYVAVMGSATLMFWWWHRHNKGQDRSSHGS